MKIKCDDGIIRKFRPAVGMDLSGRHYNESYCMECGEKFGVHDSEILKPVWKRHSCTKDERGER